MSNTENEELLLEESQEKTLSFIPSIHYRGPENHVSVIGSSRASYVFSKDTDFTVHPATWEDFYEILLLDKYNIFGRIYVLALDPIAATNLRRATQEEFFLAPEIIDNQKEVDGIHKKKNELNAIKNEYIGRINLQIARGELESIPENLELDAEKFADEQHILRHTPVVETPIDVVVDPVEEVLVEVVPETPVETDPIVETPEVETPEVLGDSSVPSADEEAEPTDVVPTGIPVDEKPSEETPKDSTEIPSEWLSMEKEEAKVDDPTMQTVPTIRKKSSPR